MHVQDLYMYVCLFEFSLNYNQIVNVINKG